VELEEIGRNEIPWRNLRKNRKTTTMTTMAYYMNMRERRVVVSKKLVSQQPVMELRIHYSMYGIGPEVRLELPDV
jgi:hypothetical protein